MVTGRRRDVDAQASWRRCGGGLQSAKAFSRKPRTLSIDLLEKAFSAAENRRKDQHRKPTSVTVGPFLWQVVVQNELLKKETMADQEFEEFSDLLDALPQHFKATDQSYK